MKDICGFLVVRKPEENFDNISSAPYYLSSEPPCIKEVCYSGINRVPWYELEENFYAEKLPDGLVTLREKIYELNQPNLDIKLIQDFESAKEILNYSNSIQDRYEIIAIYSDKLAEMKGKFSTDISIDWLGVDIFFSGYGSSIKEGIYNKPEIFDEFVDKLNPNGLFDKDVSYIEGYIEHYNDICISNNLEKMDDIDESLKDIIEIGRVKN